jgi:putative membrane protein
MRAATLAIIFTLLPLAVHAQIGNAGFMSPDTRFERPGVPAPNQPNTTDKLFAQLVAEGGMAEIDFGELAADRAKAPAVTDFARMMINDHSSANENLVGLAGNSNIPLPDQLNPEHAAMRERLENLENEAFDLEYMRGQVADHQKATQLLIWEISNGQEAELQHFAAEALPTVLEHLRLARAIVDELTQNQVAGASR